MSEKAVMYIRIGSEYQYKREEDQKKLCKAFLEGFDYEVYKDVGSGMKSPLPSLQKLLDEVEEGGVRKVVCATPSIISRDFKVLANVADDFKNAKVPLIRADTGSDLVNDVEEAVYGFIDELKKRSK